jgi:uracil-DNA glycosylase
MGAKKKLPPGESLFDLPGPEPHARIREKPVPALFPESGTVHSLLYGEAPGPRGADKSGIPFWGDGAGLPLYRALCAAGCAEVPDAAWSPWDGARLLQNHLHPKLIGTALSNAFQACPTNDGLRFRAPTRAELNSPQNLARLRRELEQAARLGAKQVITLGKCAAVTLSPLVEAAGLRLSPLPHPSAQGLLAEAPNRGRGLRLADLQARWQERLVALLRHH